MPKFINNLYSDIGFERKYRYDLFFRNVQEIKWKKDLLQPKDEYGVIQKQNPSPQILNVVTIMNYSFNFFAIYVQYTNLYWKQLFILSVICRVSVHVNCVEHLN